MWGHQLAEAVDEFAQQIIDAEKTSNKTPHLRKSFVEMLCFLCQVTFGLLGSAMVTIVTKTLKSQLKGQSALTQHFLSFYSEMC